MVSAVHVALGGERAIPALTFKARLFQAIQAGKLELGRADLVAAMDPQLVSASEIDPGGGVTYHIVVTAGMPRDERRSRPQLAVA